MFTLTCLRYNCLRFKSLDIAADISGITDSFFQLSHGGSGDDLCCLSPCGFSFLSKLYGIQIRSCLFEGILKHLERQSDYNKGGGIQE